MVMSRVGAKYFGYYASVFFGVWEHGFDHFELGDGRTRDLS